jgi:hypothetical protein
MCTGLELLAAAGTASSIKSANDQRKASKNAERQAANAETERKAEETKAQQNAYAQTQMSRKALRENSLFTGGGTSAGQQTLGV